MQLLEREPALADLTRWLKSSTLEGGSIVLVSGEAGMGKTVLLQEFAKTLTGIRVLWGACDALFTPRPLAPLLDIARQTQGKLLDAVKSHADRNEWFAAALDELERRDAPALVVLEDLHWADEATLDWLKFIGRRVHRTAAMIVVTFRDDEVTARHPLHFVLGDLPRASVHRLGLAPLSEGAVARLATQAGRSATGLHGVTRGNPLFVTEVLATNPGSVPATVRDAVLARAARLEPAARALAELVSVVPAKAESWLLRDVLNPDEATIEGCLQIGMVRDDEGALAFRHELARRAFEDSLSSARQRELHAKVLLTLATCPETPPARLVHHASGSGQPQAVLQYAPVNAVHAASLGAYREAAAHYEIALRYADHLPAIERLKLLEPYSYACYLIDQIERAIELRLTTLGMWRELGARTQEGDALRWLSRMTWFAGRRHEADRYADEAVSVLETLPPGRELAMAYSNRAQLAMLAHRTEEAVAVSHRAIALAEQLNEPGILSHALNNLGTAQLIAMNEDGWTNLERSLRIALDGRFDEHVARSYTNLASTATTQRLYEKACRYLEEGLAYCEERDLDSWSGYMLAFRARVRFERCDWDGASEDCERVLSRQNTAAVNRLPALTVLGHMRLRRGDPGAHEALEQARPLAHSIKETQRSAPLAIACADLAVMDGDPERAVRELREASELIGTNDDPWIRSELAVRLWRLGALENPPANLRAPYGQEISGDWRAAAQAWQELGCPYEAATVLSVYGGQEGQKEALVIFDQLGALPAARILRKQMRDSGVRSVPRGLRESTRANEFGLTKRENEILALLGEGLRNAEMAKRLFVSVKTVDHHVSAILTKLGVSSRAEAVTAAGKRKMGDGA